MPNIFIIFCSFDILDSNFYMCTKFKVSKNYVIFCDFPKSSSRIYAWIYFCTMNFLSFPKKLVYLGHVKILLRSLHIQLSLKSVQTPPIQILIFLPLRRSPLHIFEAIVPSRIVFGPYNFARLVRGEARIAAICGPPQGEGRGRYVQRSQ